MPERHVVLAAFFGSVALAAAIAAALAWQDREKRQEIAHLLTGGTPEQAPVLLRRYGCAGCHTIPGVRDADGRVGPVLAKLRERVFIAGRLPNDGETLVKWIKAPQSFFPSAMPDTGISEAEARDVAAYLYSQ